MHMTDKLTTQTPCIQFESLPVTSDPGDCSVSTDARYLHTSRQGLLPITYLSPLTIICLDRLKRAWKMSARVATNLWVVNFSTKYGGPL
jgi:hypothetical protein